MNRNLIYAWYELQYDGDYQFDMVTFVAFPDELRSTHYGAHQLCVI